MQLRTLGKTELKVTPLGFGAAQIGYLGLPQSDCDQLLNGLLDQGINLIDTAACYRDSEEKIGKAIGARRGDYVLVTKCGHHVERSDPPEWTPEVVRHSAERSLRRLQTDHVDVLLLHSCTVPQLKNEQMIQALQKCKEDGLTRFIGYSGDNEAAEFAIEMNVFDCLETSVSICDQHSLETSLPKSEGARMGAFAKRPLANACWRDLEEYNPFYANYAQPYTQRLKQMGFTPESLGFGGEWLELALRFTVFQPGLTSALIGSTSLEHIRENIQMVDQGPLPEDVQARIREAWRANDDGTWIGQT